MWRREEKKAVAYAYNSGKYTYEYPNAQLMADAPLLLEEVKRLRELKIAEEDELERLYNHAEFYEGEYNLAQRTNQERLTEIKRLRMIVARLEDARIENVGIHERPKLFIAVHEIYAQRLQDIYYERREEE